jgi:hypothetical protein
MLRLIERTALSLRHSGLRSTLKKIVRYPGRKKRFEKILQQSDNIEDRFTAIYERNAWAFDSDESISGTGSSLEYTQNLRSKLPELFAGFGVKSVFDAPCGDFNWMRAVLASYDVDYIGGDIVAPLVEANRARYATETIKFVHVDITKDIFPPCDLMICRDCIFHLSFSDARSALQNFVSSKIPYLLTTTHIDDKDSIKNKDIATGDYRLIDLFAPPYNFPRDVLFRIEDWRQPDPPREMCLWSRDQIIGVLKTFNG